MVVSGGPMMGAPMSWEAAMNASVTKTTSGILVLPEDGAIDRRRKTQLNHMLNRAKLPAFSAHSVRSSVRDICWDIRCSRTALCGKWL